MPNKTYAPGTVVDSGSLNAFNDVSYDILGDGVNPPATKAAARTNLGVAASGANSDITSLSGLTTPLSVAQGGTGNDGTANWVSAACTIYSGTGTLTSANAFFQYEKIGRAVFFVLTASVLTNGTGATTINVDLPFTAFTEQSWGGRENANTGFAMTGTMLASTNKFVILKYDNTYPGLNGTRFCFAGVLYTTS